MRYSNLSQTNSLCPCVWMCVCSKGNMQVLQYSSDVKKVMLLVEVTNAPSQGKVAEDAHQAMLNITIPDVLRYSGVRSPVSPHGGGRETGLMLARLDET